MYKDKQLMYLTVDKPADTLVNGVWQKDYPNTQRVGAVAIDTVDGDLDMVLVSVCMLSKSDQFETQLARNRAVGRLNSKDACTLIGYKTVTLKDCVKYLGLDDPEKHRNYFDEIDWDKMQFKFRTAIKIMQERKGLIPQQERNYN